MFRGIEGLAGLGVMADASTATKARRRLATSGSEITAGSDLLSHAVSRAVPSAVAGLTSVFGMGTGGTLLL